MGSGGIAAIKDESTALFQQCDLSEGVASNAGGIYIAEGSFVNVTRCTLAYCHSHTIPGEAGAIAAYGDAFIQDSVFEHNEADWSSGDLLVRTGGHIEVVRTAFGGTRAGSWGGSIAVGSSSSGTFTDSTFVDVQSADSGGLALLGGCTGRVCALLDHQHHIPRTRSD